MPEGILGNSLPSAYGRSELGGGRTIPRKVREIGPSPACARPSRKLKSRQYSLREIIMLFLIHAAYVVGAMIMRENPMAS